MLCRLENRVDRRALARMSGVRVEQFIASFDEPPNSYRPVPLQADALTTRATCGG